jgi:hypothetical protein
MLFSIASNAQLSSGLVLWMPFTGNANDVSTSAHITNPSNITYTTGKSGIANTAALFNGTTSRIGVAPKADLNIGKHSFCATVKPTAFNTALCQSSRILTRGGYVATNAYSLELFDNAFDSSCAVTGDTTHFTFNSFLASKPCHHKHVQYSPATTTNQWYCVVATWNDTVYRMYVNGILEYTAYPKANTAITTSTDSLMIGYSIANGSSYPYQFTGAMDEIRLYNRALTTAEIDSLCGILYINSNNPNTFCSDQSFNLNYTTTISYTSGNVFYAELSDAAGSFASPTIIGSVTSTTSGSIFCSMAATPGTGYKIRVRSTTPVIVSDAVSVTVNNNATPSVSIAVSPPASVSKGTMVTYTATVINGGASPTYQWRKNNINIPGATAATYSAIAGIDFMSGDSINVHVKSNNHCAKPDTALSNFIKIDISNGINQFASNDAFYIYPNPTKGAFTIKGKIESNEAVNIEVLNTVGQLIYTSQTSPINNILYKEITLPNASSGIYHVRLRTTNETQTLKLIIE